MVEGCWASWRLWHVESIQSCPILPIVVAQHLGSTMIEQIRSALLQPDAELKVGMGQTNAKQYATEGSA
ncbi:hypothetical protein NIES2104_63800 [Leptolyngbya sp. NIES-2104]|nr:hypothetical protein NIES2104_63800 [Leptolyngbya sp. NIES-2104]